ncbi:MAG: hypothetical protein JSU73_09210 [candidate division WOR-3 bacterium]|nr:MAG: hypothetical protein JSU73_09210 [candidate division WOR-3 bacterium]
MTALLSVAKVLMTMSRLASVSPFTGMRMLTTGFSVSFVRQAASASLRECDRSHTLSHIRSSWFMNL